MRAISIILLAIGGFVLGYELGWKIPIAIACLVVANDLNKECWRGNE